MEIRTKILGQENDADGVEKQCSNLRDDHVNVPEDVRISQSTAPLTEPGGRIVPDGYLQSNHDKLVQNERSERDRNDVQELVLKQDQGHDHNRRPYIGRNPEGDQYPYPRWTG